MGIQERREREFRRREREILDAALALCACDDWQGVTVEQIADRAEIGKGTVYKHFASKDEIYARLALEFETEAVERLERIDASLPVVQRLRQIIAIIWDQHRQGAEYHRLVQFCEREDFRKTLPDEVRAELAALDERFNAHVDRVLRDGIEQGILPRKPVQALVFGPQAALQGAVRMIWGGRLERGSGEIAHLEEITNFILAGMLYQEWLAEEGLESEQATQRAEQELRRAEAELDADAADARGAKENGGAGRI
jgi:AcrR family transcriptional regulator